jgi:hypothetical protein
MKIRTRQCAAPQPQEVRLESQLEVRKMEEEEEEEDRFYTFPM